MATTTLQTFSWIYDTKRSIVETKTVSIPPTISSNPARPRCFLDITVDRKPVGRLVVELFGDKMPKTVENFRCLCTGEAKSMHGIPLHFKGSKFHSVRPKDNIIVGGDFQNGNGSAGMSIYGKTFKNEPLQVAYDEPGTVAMVAEGAAYNESSAIFFICLEPAASNEYVRDPAFGRVREGLDTLKRLCQLGDHSSYPTSEIVIADCGQL